MILPDQSRVEGNNGTCIRRPCRVYNLWPEHKVLKSRDLSVSFKDNDTRQISLYVQTFANRPVFSVAAQSLPPSLGYSHIRLGKDIGFWLGNAVVGDSDDGSTVRDASPVGDIRLIERYQGEVDVGIMFSKSGTPDQTTVTIAAQMLDIAIPFLATSLGEYFVPITETQIDEWKGSKRTLISPQTIRLEPKARAIVSMSQLAEPFDRFCSLVANTPIEELQEIAVASRRLNSAITEDDIIDKYCDFWECCEFLSLSGRNIIGVKLPKAKDAAIATLLCNYTQPRKQQWIRNKIHEIYLIRNDLVHNAIENPERVDQSMKLIGEIALQLFRYRVGIPFKGTQELGPLLDQANR
jgi:hypothetical protein